MIRVGERLRDARIKKNLSLDDVAKATKIRASFLSAIEKGEYRKLPSSAYAQGFVSNYAEHLGFSKKEALALFRREFDEEKIFKVLPEGFANKENFPTHRLRIQQTLLVVVGVLILIAGFLAFQYRDAFIPPPLSLTSPRQTVIRSTEITVSGKTDSNAVVLINGQVVTVDENGQFQKQIAVFPGKTMIVVTARNRFGKETVLQKSITIQE